MREFSIEVQENKVGFFIELMKSLSFVRVKEDVAEFELTHAQKAELDKQLNEYRENPDKFRDWDTVSKEIEKRL